MTSNDAWDDEHFEVRDELSTEHIDGEWVVFDLERDSYFSLNEVAGVVWNELQEGKTLGTIVEEIAADYDVAVERARADAVAFLEEALEHDLVERVDGANS